MLSSFDHKNIIKIIDFYKVKNGKFIYIMEYQDSYDLDKIVNDPETIMEENKKFAD